MNPPMREVLALINIIEAESDVEERGLLVEAARTAVRRLRASRADASSAMALLDALLSEPAAHPTRPGKMAGSKMREPLYA